MKVGKIGKIGCKPLCTFTLASLALIFVMVIASGYTQSRFFEDALIDREAEIVKQTVIAPSMMEDSWGATLPDRGVLPPTTTLCKVRSHCRND